VPTARGLPDRAHRAVEHARGVTDHPVLEHVARIGPVAYAAVHFLQLAGGVRAADADRTGALQAIGRAPGGGAVLWAVALGMIALARARYPDRDPPS
jgi:Domain of Unknown Function (DUF1206)